MLHYTVNQCPHWACRQYGHTGGTRGWLGVEKWQLYLPDTSRSAKCHRQAAVGFSVCVQCYRMVDNVPIRVYYLYPVANTVRPSVDAGEMITPAQELGTPVAQGLGLTPLIGDLIDTVQYLLCYKQTIIHTVCVISIVTQMCI